MGTGDVNVLNAKLDMLISDIKSFKQITIGFLMAIVIPFAVYMVIQLVDLKMDVAVMQEKIELSDKAIRRNDWGIR